MDVIGSIDENFHVEFADMQPNTEWRGKEPAFEVLNVAL